jgi:hypothetical protein
MPDERQSFYLASFGASQADKLTIDPDDPQWYIIGAEINYGDALLFCDHCEERIPEAYPLDDPLVMCEVCGQDVLRSAATYRPTDDGSRPLCPSCLELSRDDNPEE